MHETARGRGGISLLFCVTRKSVENECLKLCHASKKELELLLIEKIGLLRTVQKIQDENPSEILLKDKLIHAREMIP